MEDWDEADTYVVVAYSKTFYRARGDKTKVGRTGSSFKLNPVVTLWRKDWRYFAIVSVLVETMAKVL